MSTVIRREKNVAAKYRNAIKYRIVANVCGGNRSAAQAMTIMLIQIPKNHLSLHFLDFFIQPARMMVVKALAMYTYQGNEGDPCVKYIDPRTSHAETNVMTHALVREQNVS